MSARGEASGRAFARAALVGNPSDGFGGKTLATVIREFSATVTVGDPMRGADLEGSGAALIEAAIARFERECPAADAAAAFRLETDIPRQVGLGGSSAIVIATLRALCTLNAVEFDPARLAEIALAVEVEDLGIPAGLQDRVTQAYGGLVYMDFAPGARDPYQVLDPALLPPLFVAYRTGADQPSAGVHAELRRRLAAGDEGATGALDEIAALAEAGWRCLLAGDRDGLGTVMSENVALRARLVELDPRHLRMVELARSLGAAANYAGSGGAIVGLVPDGVATGELAAAFAKEACAVLVPQLDT